MEARESGDPGESKIAEKLLEYDAALAAGSSPSSTISDEQPHELGDGFSCLEMLERLRQTERVSQALGTLLGDSRQDLSHYEGPFEGPVAPANERSGVLSQFGRFRLVSLLGQGGCGVVFLAHDPALCQQVAMKIPRPETLLTPELRQRFIREGRASARLNHPNLVMVFEAGETGGICYLTSAYCPGMTLKEWLKKKSGPAAPPAAAHLVATLALAMDYAHRNGVCHRDLKPGNIVLQWEEVRPRPDSSENEADVLSTLPDLQTAVPKIIDFGLAKLSESDSGLTETRTGAVFGTPHYMAPEQAKGETQVIGPAADIHALGVILYELLTGHLPYQGSTDLEIFSQIVAAEPVSPSRLCRTPRDLETICLKCLEKQPENRYASMREFGEDLQRFIEGRPIRARRISWAVRAAKWVRRRPGATAAAALTGVAVFSVVAGLIWIGSRESAHSSDMTNALHEIDSQRARAEELDWLARNQQYAAQIRSGGRLKQGNQLAELRDLLLAQKPAAGQKDLRGFEWHYLWRFGKGFRLPPRAQTVLAMAYGQNGDVCAWGSPEGPVYLVNRHTGKFLTTLVGHTYEVQTLEFLENDRQLLSTAFGRIPDGTGFRGEFILWSVAGEPRILRRGATAHHHKEFGQRIFRLARDARILFIIDRMSPSLHRLMMLDLDKGTEQELLRQENLIWFATTPNAERLAVVYNRKPEAH